MNRKNRKNMLLGGVVATLSFLPGCTDMFKGGTTTPIQTETSEAPGRASLTGEVLVSMGGQPIISTDSLSAYRENFLKVNPQLRQVLQFINAKEFDRNILEGLIADKVIAEYLTLHKIIESEDYQTRLAEKLNEAERVFNAEFFSSLKKATVSDSEVKAFYDANKDKVQGLTISQGGVAAAGIEFTDGAAARAFASRAKTAPGGFKKVAQDDDLTAKIKDFKLVNNQSIGMDEQLRDKIAAIKTVPSVEMFEVGGKFWVVNATAKEEAKYAPYEQVKEALKPQLERNKLVEVLGKEIEDLKKQYGIQINEEYFGPMEMPQEVALKSGAVPAPAADKKDAAEKRLA